MKKLISIGVALALLAMAVLPVGVAASRPPETYAKVPFAMIDSYFQLLANITHILPQTRGMPWLPTILNMTGPFISGPSAWTVDMTGWGLGLMGTVLSTIAAPLGQPMLGTVGSAVTMTALALFTPFGRNVSAPPRWWGPP